MKKYLFYIFLSFSSLSIWAQQDAKMAFYREHLQIYNPAATGILDQTLFTSNFRNQWFGQDGAPRINVISLSVPGNEKRLSWGVLLMNDKTFIESQTKAFATFSYRLPMGNNNSLFLGIQGGGNFTNVDFSGLRILNPEDQQLDNTSHFYPNVGVGAYWKSKNYFVSFSLPMLFGYSAEKTADNQEPTPADDVHSYLSAGVRLPMSKDWEFIASTLIRWVPNAPTSLVFNAGMAYQKTELSLGYHHDGTLGAQLLVQPKKGLAIGYSYQFPTPTLLSKINTSNHELMVRIPLSKKE